MLTRATDLEKASRLRLMVWLDLARAVFELGLANRKLSSRTTKDLLRTVHHGGQAEASRPLSGEQGQLVGRIAFAIARMCVRVPWRADCFVQALAAQRWLARKCITSGLYIGVSRSAPDTFTAHAWLKVNDEVVTGGDITDFVPLVTPDTKIA